MSSFTHLDSNGNVRMVDVSAKDATPREALASGSIHMTSETFNNIMVGKVKKGNVLETARIAGVMAAKKTAELIPMCHPLNLTYIEVNFFPDKKAKTIRIEGRVRLVGKTGVEMEALTAVSVAALTIYDMCKSQDREMVISDICLLEKSGGKSGRYSRRG